jgi:4-hydroxy-3-polyprenylbenzoate decarboxylase
MSSPASDLREWIALLDQEGELVRIQAEVDPDLEITRIADRVVKGGGRRSVREPEGLATRS